MHTLPRLLLAMLVAAWAGSPLLAATTSDKEKKSSKPQTSVKKTAPEASESSTKKTDPVKDEEGVDTPVMTPAAVSTISVEDIRDFDKYPKQIQSLVQSSMALTRLELGYLYGSHEPSKGGMDCSGTIYHVLHFQGLKDVPRQSDEMCNWVDKNTQLHLTPTATSFDSDEFDALKPGDLLFWTNTTKTTRKLPVTHVMIYIGKLKNSGKRIVFGSSDGRSFHGERRSGVSVFDFSLPREGSTSRLYGYGPTPGLMPFVPEPPVIAAVTPPVPTPTPAPKESAVSKEATTPKETAAVRESPAPKVVAKSKETVSPKESPTVKEPPAPKMASLTKETPASKESPIVKDPPAPKEEVRKAVALVADDPPESVRTKPDIAEAKTSAANADDKPAVKKTTVAEAPAKSTATSKPKTSAPKKKSSTVATSTRRRTPAAPPKSIVEQKIDRAVSSVRRFFQQ